jgi:hypothetical protein
MFELGWLLMEVGMWLFALGLFLGGIVLILWVGLKFYDLIDGRNK